MKQQKNSDWFTYWANVEVDMTIEQRVQGASCAHVNKCRFYRLMKKEWSVRSYV